MRRSRRRGRAAISRFERGCSWTLERVETRETVDRAGQSRRIDRGAHRHRLWKTLRGTGDLVNYPVHEWPTSAEVCIGIVEDQRKLLRGCRRTTPGERRRHVFCSGIARVVLRDRATVLERGAFDRNLGGSLRERAGDCGA